MKTLLKMFFKQININSNRKKICNMTPQALEITSFKFLNEKQ